MRRQYEQFEQLGCEVLDIGPDTADAFRAYWDKYAMPFPGLADPKHRVSKLSAQPFRLLKLGRMPMQLLIDPSGIIRERHEGQSMSDIAPVQTVLQQIENLSRNG